MARPRTGWAKASLPEPNTTSRESCGQRSGAVLRTGPLSCAIAARSRPRSPPLRPSCCRGRNGACPPRPGGPSPADTAAYTSVLLSVKERALPYVARGNALLAEGRAKLALLDYSCALSLTPDIP